MDVGAWWPTVHVVTKSRIWLSDFSKNSILQSRDTTLPTKVHLVKAMVFPVVMYGCKSWTVKKAEYLRIDVFELWCWRRLLSPLGCKEIQPAHPKGDQSWMFIGRTDVEAALPILWPPDEKSWLIGKYPDAEKDWRWEKGRTEGEMVEWRHWLNGHELEHTQGDGEGQESLECCSPWGHKVSDMTEPLKNNSSDEKYPGVPAWWVLFMCKSNFIVMRA